MSKSSRCWHCRALGQDICKPGVTCQQWQLCQSFETHLQDPFTSHNPRKFCPHQSKFFYNCSALERSEKIKIVNCNFHKQITYHVTVLISEQFLGSWLDHFPLAKFAKREVYVPEKKPYIKWEKARKPLSNGQKWANFLPRNHVTYGISEQVSDFCLGHRKWLFWSEEKQ